MKAFMTPLRSFQSMGLSPAAATFTLISPGPGLGSAISCGESLLESPYSFRTIAFMELALRTSMRSRPSGAREVAHPGGADGTEQRGVHDEAPERIDEAHV